MLWKSETLYRDFLIFLKTTLLEVGDFPPICQLDYFISENSKFRGFKQSSVLGQFTQIFNKGKLWRVRHDVVRWHCLM